ncbi:MAG: NADH:flavin oxidoreductase [Schwartzia sp. (in: firmicutes)]
MGRIDEPIAIGRLACRNRIVRSATHSFLGTREGRMGEVDFAMYEALAKNGIGLIVSGHCCVSPTGRANEEQINVFDDRAAEDVARAVRLVHAAGSRLVFQISHAGPRAIGVSDLADVTARPLKKGREARALRREEIFAIREDFIAAARRLQRAGADGVQLHAAHSYLLSRFLDPTFNQRTDEYGGDAESRFRLVGEIVAGIKAACGTAFPVLLKINSDTKADDTAYEADLRYMLQEARRLGVELVELSGVDFLSEPRTATLYYLERAKRLRRAVEEPMSLVGGVRSLADMEAVIASGLDMVSLGRPLVCEPDLLPRLRAGQERSSCLGCNRCFVIAHLHPGMRCVRERKLRKKAGGSESA